MEKTKAEIVNEVIKDINSDRIPSLNFFHKRFNNVVIFGNNHTTYCCRLIKIIVNQLDGITNNTLSEP